MMRVKPYIYITILLVFFLTIFIDTNASAHSPSACRPGSEGVGWKVNCTSTYGHLGTPVTTYSYASNVAQKYKNATSQGATRWNNTGIVRITYSASSNNVIGQYSNANSTVLASANATTFNNHKARWWINYNHGRMNSMTTTANNTTATHELGHAVGLADLSNSSNRNKLMFGNSTSRSVTTIQSADRTGAREAVK